MLDFIIAKEENNVDLETESLLSFVYGKSKQARLHKHDYYELFLVINGSITHLINGEKQVLDGGTLVLIRPNDIHTQICKDSDTCFANLTFTKNVASNVLNYLFDESTINELLLSSLPRVIILNSNSKQRLIERLNELNALRRSNVSGKKILLKSILAEILPLFITNLQLSNKHDMPLWLQDTLTKMSNPINFTQGASKMLEISKKSREHLARSLKKYLNVSVSEYINELKINYATNLLINTNMSIIDVCFACGFQNLSRFYKVFENKYNLTPKSYRKKFTISINV